MYRKILVSSISALAVAAALGAQAQAYGGFGGPRGPVPFGVMDADGDGYVSSEEFSRHRDARMAARAAQGRPLRNARFAPRFESWDADSDGWLSRGEVAAGQQARFAARRSVGRPCRRYQ